MATTESARATSSVQLLILTATMTLLYGTIDPTRSTYAHWDLVAYRSMAAAAPGLAPDIAKPFAYRILGPWLAGVAPVDVDAGFFVLSRVAALAATWLLLTFLLSTGVSRTAAVVASALFVGNKHAFGFPVWDYFQLGDLLTLAVLPVLFAALLQRRWRVFGIALLVGALAREWALLMVPAGLVQLWETRQLREQGRKAALAAAPALVATIALRWGIAAPGAGLFDAFATYAPKLLEPQAWFRLLVNAFLPVSLVPLVLYRQTIAFFRTRRFALVFLVLTFLGALFGSNNERLMAPAFVVVYWLVATCLDGPWGRTRGRLATLLVAGLASSLHYEMARWPILDRNATIAVSLAALGVATWTALSAARSGPEDHPAAR